MSLFQQLQSDMLNYNFYPSKEKSQNFLIDENIIELMVDSADLNENDIVLEIGMGNGFLSKKILEKSKLLGVELDEKLIQLLKEKFKDNKKFTLLEGDVLKVNFSRFTKIVSAPPYSISTPLFLKLALEDFELGVFLLQEEFSQKLLSEPGFYDYVSLSLIIQTFFDVTFIKNISNSVFFPKPKTNSTIISLTKKQDVNVLNREKYILLVRRTFRFKKKNLSNALKHSESELIEAFKVSKEQFRKYVSECDLREEKVMVLGVNDFIKIYNELDDLK